ncbi:MAG: glycosyltransferase [Candidatus Lokiarchaeota archaeon]|nr:glycosyltransferase [Candidatus Lokiarchaeota archaeon]
MSNKKSINSTFLYPDSPKSPHLVHLNWAKHVCQNIIQTPMPSNLRKVWKIFFKEMGKIPHSDVLLLESLYCLPIAARYKKIINPNCKIVSIIADTSFWKEKMNILRRIFYKIFLRYINGFITVSYRIKNEIKKYIKRPTEVVRPFMINEFKTGAYKFNKKILFIGNEAKEKGFLNLIESMKLLENYELFLVGDCYKGIGKTANNVNVEGRVDNLAKYFNSCSIYVHPADYDPCPVSIFEAMHAGLIPIISKYVGQSEIFPKKLKNLIVQNNQPMTIKQKIKEVEAFSDDYKFHLIEKAIIISLNYKKDKSIKDFKEKFYKILDTT